QGRAADTHAEVAPFDQERHAGLPGAAAELSFDGRLLAGRKRDPAPDDRGLFAGDGLERGAEVGLVVEVDTRDDLHGGAPHGGRIESGRMPAISPPRSPVMRATASRYVMAPAASDPRRSRRCGGASRASRAAPPRGRAGRARAEIPNAGIPRAAAGGWSR